METQKQELLAHYAAREPKEFYQFDGFNYPTGMMGYRGDHEDADGDELYCGRTYELMHGATVRILITPNTSKEDAVRLLKKLTAWIEKGDPMAITIPPILVASKVMPGKEN